MPHQVELTLWIVVSIALGIFILFLLFYPLIKKALLSHFTIRFYYKKVRNVADDLDFYLINKWEFKFGKGKNDGAHIDHILIGNKFIYVIKDFYYDGLLSAKEKDSCWRIYKNHKKQTIDNPLINNKIRADRISVASNQKRDYFISIVLINDDCYISPIKCSSKDNFILPLSKLEKFVKEEENRKDVNPFSQVELEYLVRDLRAINLNKKE